MERTRFISLYSKDIPVRVLRSSGTIEDDWRIFRIRPLTCLADDDTVGYICVMSPDDEISKWVFIKEFLELNAAPQVPSC